MDHLPRRELKPSEEAESLLAAAAPVAESQLGLVTHFQLVDAGIAESTIHQAVVSGRLRRVARGVYLLAGAPRNRYVDTLAVVLSAGPGAVLSHQSAAWLWDLVDRPPTRIHVSVPRPRQPRTEGATIHRSGDLHLVIGGRKHGIPVTDVGRTILDCAASPGIDVQLINDEARRRHRISDSLLPFVVAQHSKRGRSGLAALRHVVLDDELPHSDFERIVARWLVDQGIDGWRLHHRLVLPGYGPCELDFAWADDLVALELEGADHRDRARVHDHDTERQNALLVNGWSVLRTTYRRWVSATEAVRREIEAARATAQATGCRPRVVDAVDAPGSSIDRTGFT